MADPIILPPASPMMATSSSPASTSTSPLLLPPLSPTTLSSVTSSPNGTDTTTIPPPSPSKLLSTLSNDSTSLLTIPSSVRSSRTSTTNPNPLPLDGEAQEDDVARAVPPVVASGESADHGGDAGSGEAAGGGGGREEVRARTAVLHNGVVGDREAGVVRGGWGWECGVLVRRLRDGEKVGLHCLVLIYRMHREGGKDLARGMVRVLREENIRSREGMESHVVVVVGMDDEDESD